MIDVVAGYPERYDANDRLEYWVRRDMGWDEDSVETKFANGYDTDDFELAAVRDSLAAVDWNAVQHALVGLQADCVVGAAIAAIEGGD
jgi:hypothetical protein